MSDLVGGDFLRGETGGGRGWEGSGLGSLGGREVFFFLLLLLFCPLVGRASKCEVSLPGDFDLFFWPDLCFLC